uniref:Eukaryotic translation elongation factor 1 epsilon-1 n=1 Tax=Magallana gigas TaxID=29159 RepID=K1QFX0_MAGGI
MDELNSLASYLSVSSGKLVLDAKEQVTGCHFDYEALMFNMGNIIPVLKAGNGLTVRGLVSVAKQLVRQSETPELKGTTAEERAAIDQWLEYRVVQVDRSLQEKDVSTVLRDTNAYLSHHVYFVGYQPTLADIILYLGLYRIFMQSLFADKMSKKHIAFQRNKIFSDNIYFFGRSYIVVAEKIEKEAERRRRRYVFIERAEFSK